MSINNTESVSNVLVDRVALSKRLRLGTGSHRYFGDAPSKAHFKSCTGGIPLPDAAFILLYLAMGGNDISVFNFRPQLMPGTEGYTLLCDAIDKRAIEVTKVKKGIPLLNRRDFVDFVKLLYPDCEIYLPWLIEAASVNHLAESANTQKKKKFLETAQRVVNIDILLHGESTTPLGVAAIIDTVYRVNDCKFKSRDLSKKSFSAERRWLKEANIRRDSRRGARETDRDKARVGAIRHNLLEASVVN